MPTAADKLAMMTAQPRRQVTEFTIPPTLRFDETTKVGLRALTAAEELQSAKLGGRDLMKMQYEATKRAICELDGVAVSNTEGRIDTFWEAAGPKLRSLLLQAYSQLSSADDEEDAAFFGSKVVKV